MRAWTGRQPLRTRTWSAATRPCSFCAPCRLARRSSACRAGRGPALQRLTWCSWRTACAPTATRRRLRTSRTPSRHECRLQCDRHVGHAPRSLVASSTCSPNTDLKQQEFILTFTHAMSLIIYWFRCLYHITASGVFVNPRFPNLEGSFVAYTGT